MHPCNWSPDILRGTTVFGPVRVSVPPAYLSNRPLDFSEILHEVVLSERKMTDILGFLIKILVCPPGGQKGSKCP